MKTKVFTLRDVYLKLDNGKQVIFQIVDKKDTALIVPITKDGKLILIKEYFVAIDQYLLTAPKGRIDDGYSQLETANKELQEEIGYKSKNIVKLGTLTMSPGYLTQKTHVFLARNLIKSKLQGDEHFPIEIKKFNFKNFEKLIDTKKINEARTIAALYMAKRFLEKKKK